MKPKKLFYSKGQNLFVYQFTKTSNKKISEGAEAIVQTYTFSMDQFNLVKSGSKFTMLDFFALDRSNCLDCPFSGNVAGKAGKCYTHKVIQYFGFLSMLKSIDINNVGPLTESLKKQIIENSAGKYVRFGTYGEPSLIDFSLVQSICAVAKNWTGYTHQYSKDFAVNFGSYFMASVHSEEERKQAEEINFRSFVITSDGIKINDLVNCPAAKESGYKTNCAKCGLCSGLLGKGKKSVSINLH